MFGNHLVLKFAPQKIADVTAVYFELVLASRQTHDQYSFLPRRRLGSTETTELCGT